MQNKNSFLLSRNSIAKVVFASSISSRRDKVFLLIFKKHVDF